MWRLVFEKGKGFEVEELRVFVRGIEMERKEKKSFPFPEFLRFDRLPANY